MLRPSRRRAREIALHRAGFTLLELMVTVTIIATTAALAVPGIQGALASQRAARAALDFVSVGRAARHSAIGSGRAFLMHIDAGGDAVRLYRGITNRCGSNDWTVIMGGPACGVAGSLCVAGLDYTGSNYTRGGHAVDLVSDDGQAVRQICYQPDGTMSWRNGTAGAFTTAPPVGNGFRYRIQRLRSGTPILPDRILVVPAGGSIRRER